MLSPLEFVALLFSLCVLIKIAVVLCNKKAWYDHVVHPLYRHRDWWVIVFAFTALIVFYVLLNSLSLVEIMGVMAFSSLLVGVALMTYTPEITAFMAKYVKHPLDPIQKALMLVFALLSLLAIYQIVFG